jgi:hypothetical protein
MIGSLPSAPLKISLKVGGTQADAAGDLHVRQLAGLDETAHRSMMDRQNFGGGFDGQ